MNCFYYSYVGNKRAEMKYIEKYIKLENIKTIVEPFCGSSIFSRYIFEKYEDKYMFHINDNSDELHNFIDYVKEKKGSKDIVDEYNEINNKIKNKDDYKEYFKNSIDPIYPLVLRKLSYKRYGLYNEKRKRGIMTYNKNLQKLDKFFLNPNLKFTKDDYKKTMEEYKNDENALLFVDPPYLGTDCSYYNDNNCTEIYGYIIDYINTCKCKVIIVIIHNVLINYCFKGFIKEIYDKTYSFTKRNVKHCIITNFD